MPQKVRCAVVGVGHLGRFHAQKYKALSDHAELIGVSDLNEAQGKKVSEELGVTYYKDYSQLFGKVDAVTIAATTTAHYQIAKSFLTEGIHVHVEKPMTSTSQEGEELVALAERKKVKLQVGHVERFNPALIAARDKLNKPLFIEVHRLAPFKPRGADVDVVLDLMIHDLDVVTSLVGSDLVSVSAVGTQVLTKTNDIANARLEYANGAVANITCSRVSQRAERKFRVFQPNQYLSIDFGSGEVNLLTKVGEFKDNEIPLEAEAWNLEKGDALLSETKSFLDAIQQNKPCVVSGQDGLLALRLAEKIIGDIERRKSKRN